MVCILRKISSSGAVPIESAPLLDFIQKAGYTRIYYLLLCFFCDMIISSEKNGSGRFK